MKIKILILLTLGLNLSCKLQNRMGDFKLLPHPQEWKINGNSELDPTDLKHYFSPSGLALPAGSGFLGKATITDASDQAQLVYTIDSTLNIKAEGYLMDIMSKKVKITAQERKLAIKAAKILNLAVAGVDIIRSNKGPLLLEVNSSPGLEGIENATGIDIANEMIMAIEKKLKYSLTSTLEN